MAIRSKKKVTTKQVEKVVKEVATRFMKQQLLKSKKYVLHQDALNALLEDDKTYTIDQVDEILEKFYKGGHK